MNLAFHLARVEPPENHRLVCLYQLGLDVEVTTGGVSGTARYGLELLGPPWGREALLMDGSKHLCPLGLEKKNQQLLKCKVLPSRELTYPITNGILKMIFLFPR